MLNLSANQVRQHLCATINFLGSQKDAARVMGVSTSFLNDVVKGRRKPTGKILKYLKIERVEVYRFKRQFD